MTYINEAKLLLQAFEQTQGLMLQLELQESVEEFETELISMENLFQSKLQEFQDKSFPTTRDKILLTRQIERLIKFIWEMTGHLANIRSTDSASEEFILFVFNRQHLFKNIYKKHLSDFISIIG